MPPDGRLLHVLVVDDSVVMRRIVARVLERDPAVGRTSAARNGREALEGLARQRPDLVVLDLEMPELDGFATLAEIRRRDPQLPVVLFSSVDERVAARTLEAMRLGVTEFVAKPSAGALDLAEAYVEQQLVPAVKALAAPRDLRTRARPAVRAAGQAAVRVVVVGVSTGGPDALVTVMGALPGDLPVPVLVVQHMPPIFTALLAQRLDRVGTLHVGEAAHGQELRPGWVLVAQGGRHLELVGTRSGASVALSDGPLVNSCRPSADVLFRSAVGVFGAGVLAVVLTGMGQDGLHGCRAVREARGQVVVQDPATAVIGSMPAAVADAGLAQAVLPLDLLVPEIVQRVRGVSVR